MCSDDRPGSDGYGLTQFDEQMTRQRQIPTTDRVFARRSSE
jgi:hypothetical protein